MAELPYVINNGTLPKFFSTIQQVGVPPKITHQWLGSIGFKSKNDRYLVAMLKDIGFVASDGKPERRWNDYRHTSEAPRVMAAAIKEGWSGLFGLYPDAHRRDDEAVRNWMRSHAPGASPTTVDRSLKTFRALVPLAKDALEGNGHPQSDVVAPESADASPPTMVTTIPAVPGMPKQATPEVIINIQLQIPETDNAEIYDRFFAAMKKHLFPGDE